MDLPLAKCQRAVAGLVLFCLAAALGLGLWNRRTPWQDPVGQWSYDTLHQFYGELPLRDSPVVVVYLDLPSYKSQGADPLKPWPRQLHAQLLRRLSADGARAVIFDIIFSDAGPDPAADRAFAEAIRSYGRVVLAAEANYESSHATSDTEVRGLKHSIIPPAELFERNAAAVGLALQSIDDDYGVRLHRIASTAGEPTLTWAAAKWLRLPVAQAMPGRGDASNGRWIRYYGPPLSVPHVSFSEALDPRGVPDGFFRDKIVFVGARPWVEQFHERQDEFRNPFGAMAGRKLFMPGVEVHATELLNLVRADGLRRLSARGESWVLVLGAALLGGGLVWLRPIPATFAALLGAALALGLTLLGFARGLWFPWLLVSGVQAPVAWAGSVLFHSIDWYRSRKRFEAEKRVADAKIREQAALIEKAHDAILVQDLEGRTFYANPSAERLYGWPADDLRNRPGDILWPDAQAAKAARAAVLLNGEWNGELRQQTRDGRTVIVASRWTLIRDSAGRAASLLIINTDITEQKQLEAQFLRTQRLNTIGTLAGGMAHDLNNALAPVLMGAQLLRRKLNDHESLNLLGLMENSTHRGADMVRQVLLFARGRGGEFERLEVGPLVKELEKLIRETFPKTITFEAFLPTDLWPVQGNPTQLHQVLLNLCVNARDAMPKGGKLSIAADNLELEADEAAAISEGRPGDFVSLLVSDTGIGIPPPVKARLFEPFFTTKGEGHGTGIGLSTALRIVKAHQGFLRVESEPGQGTTFEVFLPRAPQAPPVEEKLEPELLRASGERLLLADDEQAIRELLTAELTSFGYRVLAVSNGAEAVAAFREHSQEVRVFITDRAMPVMSGLAAVTAVRKLRPDLPVILTSGNPEEGQPNNVVLLSKPFGLPDLLAAIQALLR